MTLPVASNGNSAAQPSETPAQTEQVRNDEGFSHLPLLCIDTDGTEIAYGIPGWCEISLVDNSSGFNNPLDPPSFVTASTIWQRGQSSAAFDKRSYGIEFFEQTGGDKKQDIPVLGMAPGHDWVLHGPYLDKTLMRNSLSYHIARESMFWASDTRYCELFLNGEYEGIYLIVESPRINENRIALKDYALLTGETAYLLERNRPDTDTTPLNTYGLLSGKTYYPLFVCYPVDDMLTEKKLAWITQDISSFERALYADYFLDEKRGYKAYIDMDSFVTYYIINEFSMLKDSAFLSTYCTKDLGGKLLMGPVWDYNNAYDNSSGSPTYPGKEGDGFVIADNNWFARLTEDRAFVDAVVKKYHEMRQGVLSTNSLLSYLEQTETYLGDAVQRNFERWPQSLNWVYLGYDEHENPRDLPSHEAAMEQLKAFIIARGEYLDENIELLYNNCVN
jgi:hypothetical protein